MGHAEAMNPSPLAGRVALVTGSSRGIGRGIAVALAEAGASVAVNYLDNDEAGASAAEEIASLGVPVALVKADVSRAEEVARLFTTVSDQLGPPTVVVNNAGIGQRLADVADLDEELWRRTVEVNLTSAYLVTHAALPAMRNQGWGRIINVASTAAQTGGSVGPHYAASKAGIIGLTHGYASMLVKEGITVNAIAMAQIETDLLRNATAADPSRIPVGRFGDVSEVADVALLLATNAYITGQTISVNGGMYYTS